MQMAQDQLTKQNEKVNSDEKVVNKTFTEPLKYSEPKKTANNDKIFVESVSILKEEHLDPTTPVKENEDGKIQTEVLFKSGVETFNFNEDVKIKEESLVFMEPVKPVRVSEEVLFGKKDEEANINYSLLENSILSESGMSNLLATEGPLSTIDEDDLQMSFGDLEYVTDDINFTPLTVAKIPVVKKSFTEKMLEADDDILNNYDELKNLLLSFKKVKSRISNTCDTFNLGRVKLAKLSVSGKSLKLYLNLDIDSVEPRLRCKDASAKKSYQEVPVFLRVRSPRALKNAKYLIEQLTTKHELIVNPKAEKVNSLEILKENLAKK